ncbi:MAG: hypothetical protein HC846_11220 [Blastocatellia bacterium]|nr:hypothetical protein [Blastocatellia bacterium]
MSSGSLFEEEKSNPLGKIYIIIGLVVLIIVSIVGFFAYRSNQERVKAARDVRAEENFRDTVIMMLSHSRFSGDEFRDQILGKGRLERFERVNEDLYFTYPAAGREEFDEFVKKFFVDKAKLEMAKESDGRLQLGGYSVGISEQTPYFFRTSVKNFKVDSSQMLTFPFKTVNYTMSLPEAKNFLDNTQVYGGNLVADATQRSADPMTLFANHAIMVGKPNEPSLIRLVNDLLKNVPDNRESKIQRLVDFVSNEIEYSYTEALGGGETLKRPNEILMTRNGDCSNKTILLASLLEQIGEDYLMLYCPRHITVAVQQGNFPNENKMDFEWEKKNWLIAENDLAEFSGRSN